MVRYECDNCGACCQGTLIVDADSIDVLREPRLIDIDPHFRGKAVEQVVAEIEDEMKSILLACGTPCPFLGDNNRCQIYPTRPNVCVAMLAGDEQCQEARKEKGLPPLPPSV